MTTILGITMDPEPRLSHTHHLNLIPAVLKVIIMELVLDNSEVDDGWFRIRLAERSRDRSIWTAPVVVETIDPAVFVMSSVFQSLVGGF